MDDQEKQEYESPAVEQVETEDHPAVTASGDATGATGPTGPSITDQ